SAGRRTPVPFGFRLPGKVLEALNAPIRITKARKYESTKKIVAEQSTFEAVSFRDFVIRIRPRCLRESSSFGACHPWFRDFAVPQWLNSRRADIAVERCRGTCPCRTACAGSRRRRGARRRRDGVCPRWQSS